MLCRDTFYEQDVRNLYAIQHARRTSNVMGVPSVLKNAVLCHTVCQRFMLHVCDDRNQHQKGLRHVNVIPRTRRTVNVMGAPSVPKNALLR